MWILDSFKILDFAFIKRKRDDNLETIIPENVLRALFRFLASRAFEITPYMQVFDNFC